MKKRSMLGYHLLIVFQIILFNLKAQSSSPQRVNLYIQCNAGCDMNYLRQEANYVNFVRDQDLSDVQIFINRIGNGGGGSTYQLDFKGCNAFEGTNQKLKYQTKSTATSDEVRTGLLKYIQAGLVPYLFDAGMADQVNVNIKQAAHPETSNQQSLDPWNYWIFEVNGEGSFQKESSQSGVDWELGFQGDRVTEDWRVRSNMQLNYTEKHYVGTEDQPAFTSIRTHHYANGSVVKSISNHWSAGIFSGINHNSYDNLDISCYLNSALEYSLFPYRDVIHREIVIAYRVGYQYNDYIEKTIYDKNKESLLNQNFSIEARFRQPWGNVSSSLNASTYLHDFSKNRLRLNSYVSVRVFKGLAVRMSTEMDLIRDQITLPARDASLEEILLSQRQIATNFRLDLGLGVSYTFGSAFNGIVNTRL